MKFVYDHDYHIHSHLSFCSDDPNQTTNRILQYAKENGLKEICITDHYWDRTIEIEERFGRFGNWYREQDFERISKSLPLPQEKGIKFLFGCEGELDGNKRISIPPFRYDDFDFMIIPTTHLHMKGFTLSVEEYENDEKYKADLWVKRLEFVLSQDLPFSKIGIAHLACTLIDNRSRQRYLKVLESIKNEDLERVFTKAAKVGVGIELNKSDMSFKEDEAETVLRMFRVAKECGCKFYCGTDAHHPENFKEAKDVFERAINLLSLRETDKFKINQF